MSVAKLDVDMPAMGQQMPLPTTTFFYKLSLLLILWLIVDSIVFFSTKLQLRFVAGTSSMHKLKLG
jgi:hypothetical protein